MHVSLSGFYVQSKIIVSHDFLHSKLLRNCYGILVISVTHVLLKRVILFLLCWFDWKRDSSERGP